MREVSSASETEGEKKPRKGEKRRRAVASALASEQAGQAGPFEERRSGRSV